MDSFGGEEWSGRITILGFGIRFPKRDRLTCLVSLGGVRIHLSNPILPLGEIIKNFVLAFTHNVLYKSCFFILVSFIIFICGGESKQ